jgi:glycosyltransferase involved in cell wall biosynthesis
MIIVHLTSSTFFGGPERQMLGLAQHLVPAYRSVFISFSEKYRCQAFLHEARRQGFDGWELRNDTPRWAAAIREIRGWLEETHAGILCCHGYKANFLGRWAARRQNVPVVAVSRGWTGEDFKVRCYEAIDRFFLRRMDRVICVSQGQAAKVIRAKVPASKVTVIRNAIDAGRFARPNPAYRDQLRRLFPVPPARIVGAAGRLSPEKGFSVLVQAARNLVRTGSSVGFVLFGDGPLRDSLQRQVNDAGLQNSFVLAGFRNDLDCMLPFLDLFVAPSFTEGLPNVILEAFAAGVPVVATAVGGTPEIVDDEVSGFLVPSGNAQALADRISRLLNSDDLARTMGQRGRQRVLQDFTFEAQAAAYRRLFTSFPNSVWERQSSKLCFADVVGQTKNQSRKEEMEFPGPAFPNKFWERGGNALEGHE